MHMKHTKKRSRDPRNRRIAIGVVKEAILMREAIRRLQASLSGGPVAPRERYVVDLVYAKIALLSTETTRTRLDGDGPG